MGIDYAAYGITLGLLGGCSAGLLIIVVYAVSDYIKEGRTRK